VGAPAPPRAVKKNFLGVIDRKKFVNAPPGHEVHPEAERESIFRKFFAGRVRFGGLFSSFRPSFEGND